MLYQLGYHDGHPAIHFMGYICALSVRASTPPLAIMGEGGTLFFCWQNNFPCRYRLLLLINTVYNKENMSLRFLLLSFIIRIS